MESSNVVMVERHSQTAHHTDFVCADCKQVFENATAFGDHFERLPGSIKIIGCKRTSAAAVAAEKAQPAA